jgi:hypothetical protein
MVSNSDFKGYQTTLEELCEGLTTDRKYSHLQVFLHRIGSIHKIGQDYFFVSRRAFGKVKLININYNDNQVNLELQDSNTGLSKQFTLDVNDKEFKFLLVAWEDIIKMVMEDSLVKTDEGDLLKFDY